MSASFNLSSVGPSTQAEWLQSQFTRNSRSREPSYRQRLIPYNIYVDQHAPPALLSARAMAVITAPGVSLSQQERHDKSALARALASEDESTIIRVLHLPLIPQLQQLLKRLKHSGNQLWRHAISIPPKSTSSRLPPLLSGPKPDAMFGFSDLEVLSDVQREAAALFDTGVHSFTQPDGRVFYPFIGLDFKASARRNTRWVAENQEVNAGAIVLEGIRRIALYGRQLDLSQDSPPLYFSIAADNEIATVHLHCIGRDAQDRFTYHSSRLETYVLLKPDDLDAYQRAVQNILHYGEHELLPWFCELLDDCQRQFATTKKRPLEGFEVPQPKRTRLGLMYDPSRPSPPQPSVDGLGVPAQEAQEIGLAGSPGDHAKLVESKPEQLTLHRPTGIRSLEEKSTTKRQRVA